MCALEFGKLSTGGLSVRIVLNIIWLVFAGLWATILWCLAGIVMCILIITIPFGIQAFKIASFTIWPSAARW